METITALLPQGIDVLTALFLIAASIFTSALTAAFGIGGGVAMLALLGLFVPVAALIPVHGAVQLGSNTGRAIRQSENIRWPVGLPFMAGSVVGAVAGAFVVVQLPDSWLKLTLGAFILAITWGRFGWIARLSRAGLAIASALLALLSMFVGATGPLVSPVLARFLENDRKGLVATHAAAMVVQHGLKLVVFGIAGFAFGEWVPLVAAMIVAGFAGTLMGTRLLEAMPEETFKRWFRVGISLLAADLVRRGLIALF